MLCWNGRELLFVLGVGFIPLCSCNCTKLKVGRFVVFQSSFDLQLQHPFLLKEFIL